jgi:hypothetical protein
MNKHIVSSTFQLAAIQRDLDERKVYYERNRRLSDCLGEIQQKCMREISEILGSKYQDYLKFRQKARDIARTKRPLFTATPEGRKAKNEFQKTRLAEANLFIKDLGIETDVINLVLSKFQDESRSVIEETRRTGKLLDVGHISPEVAEPNHPWIYIYPPYYGSSSNKYVSHCGHGDFEQNVIHHESHLTGEISLFTQNGIFDPGDSSFGLVVATSGLGIRFQMPVTGRLNIWSYLECVEASYGGYLSDEWGWSDATIEQYSQYYTNVGLAPNFAEAKFELLNYSRGDEDGEWAGNMAQPGEIKYCNLITDIEFSAEEEVRIGVGIIDYQYTTVNDKDVIMNILSNWILRKLAISVIH